MLEGLGRPVFSGVAIGKAYVYDPHQCELPVSCGDSKAELEKFNLALETAREQLTKLFEKTSAEIGEEQAMILDVQIMMLDDLDFIESAQDMIAGGASAAQAAHDAGDAFSAAFAAMDDEYMKARAVDVKDMARRLVDILCGGHTGFRMDEPGILVAEDLTPSETVQLPKDKILAFVTRQGSANSHTAILARIMNIPTLVQADISISPEINGKLMIVDGYDGRYYIDPDPAVVSSMVEKLRKAMAYKAELDKYRGKPSVSKSGKKVLLCANIGSAQDVRYALEGDAEGVGLMRSEFLYLGRDNFPTEEELYQAYKTVAEQLNGRPLVIRTLDIGADKQADYFGLEHEENPALGYRGIRICLTREDIFRPQMRAISVDEVRQIKEFCRKIQSELYAENIPFGEVELGIMIETPAAAIISRELAKEASFFSVGTNDLTQYTLAIDRQNARLEAFHDPHHPAILSLLRTIAENAHAEGIWAGICGELGADLSLTDTFLEMGYDELSVSPGKILALRKKVCESEA